VKLVNKLFIRREFNVFGQYKSDFRPFWSVKVQFSSISVNTGAVTGHFRQCRSGFRPFWSLQEQLSSILVSAGAVFVHSNNPGGVSKDPPPPACST
jgi:hypothetical protein